MKTGPGKNKRRKAGIYKCDGCPQIFFSPQAKWRHKSKSARCGAVRGKPGPVLTPDERALTPQQLKNQRKREYRAARNQKNMAEPETARRSPREQGLRPDVEKMNS